MGNNSYNNKHGHKEVHSKKSSRGSSGTITLWLPSTFDDMAAEFSIVEHHTLYIQSATRNTRTFAEVNGFQTWFHREASISDVAATPDAITAIS